MNLSVIIVSYNTKELLRRCLESVRWDTRYVIRNMETIIIDNGSKDGSREYLERFKVQGSRFKVKLIENKRNLGFAKANNQGIKEAKGKYVLLLNSDTEIRKGVLAKLVEFARKYPRAGVVGPRLINSDGSIQPSVYHFLTATGAIKEYWLGQKGAYEKYVPSEKKSVEVDAVVGAAMLVPKKVFDEVGPLDERYFMYFEDLDFCRRVKRAGLKVFYLPIAEITHHHGASGKEISKETHQWLVESSKIYHGLLNHYLINFIIWSSQKWQRLIEKRK